MAMDYDCVKFYHYNNNKKTQPALLQGKKVKNNASQNAESQILLTLLVRMLC